MYELSENDKRLNRKRLQLELSGYTSAPALFGVPAPIFIMGVSRNRLCIIINPIGNGMFHVDLGGTVPSRSEYQRSRLESLELDLAHSLIPLITDARMLG